MCWWPCCKVTTRRLDGSGQHVWRANSGVSATQNIKTDSAGNVLVVSSSTTNSVVKYTSAGTKLWSYDIAPALGQMVAFDIDGADGIYVALKNVNSGLIPQPGSKIAKFDKDGNFLWSIATQQNSILWLGLDGNGRIVTLEQGAIAVFPSDFAGEYRYYISTYTSGTPAAAIASTESRLLFSYADNQWTHQNSKWNAGQTCCALEGNSLIVTMPRRQHSFARIGLRIFTDNFSSHYPAITGGTFTVKVFGVETAPITFNPDNPIQVMNDLTAAVNALPFMTALAVSATESRQCVPELGVNLAPELGTNWNYFISMLIWDVVIVKQSTLPIVPSTVGDIEFGLASFTSADGSPVTYLLEFDKQFYGYPAWGCAKLSIDTGEPEWLVDTGVESTFTSLAVDSSGRVVLGGSAGTGGATTLGCTSATPPTISWAANHGTPVQCVALDPNGNAYSVAAPQDNGSGTTATTRKYDSSGVAGWTENHGAFVTGVTVPAPDTVYICGFQTSM